MAVTDLLRSLIRDLLPEGPFWRGPAADRLVESLTGAFQTIAEFLDELPAAINPRTAAKPVLLQWWYYLTAGVTCVAPPADTEELRAAVILFLQGTNGGTASAVTASILAFLPFVQVRENLDASWLPAEVPFVVEATGRVFQIWYPPSIYVPEEIACIAEHFARAGDDLIISPPELFLNEQAVYAGNAQLHWRDGLDCILRVEHAFTDGGLANRSGSLTLTTDDGYASLEDLLTVPAAVTAIYMLTGDLRWWLERDYGAGAVEVVPEASRFILRAVPALLADTGVTVTILYLGHTLDESETATGFDLLDSGTDPVAANTSPDGLLSLQAYGERAYAFVAGDNSELHIEDSTAEEIGKFSGSDWLLFLAFRVAGPPVSGQYSILWRGWESGAKTGYQLAMNTDGKLQLDAGSSSAMTSSDHSAQWVATAIYWNSDTSVVYFASSLGDSFNFAPTGSPDSDDDVVLGENSAEVSPTPVGDMEVGLFALSSTTPGGFAAVDLDAAVAAIASRFFS